MQGVMGSRVLWESYWPKVQQKNLLENPVQSYGSLTDQRSNLWSQMINHTRKTLNCRSPRKTAWSRPLFKIYFFTQECCLVYLTRPQKSVGNWPFLSLGPTWPNLKCNTKDSVQAGARTKVRIPYYTCVHTDDERYTPNTVRLRSIKGQSRSRLGSSSCQVSGWRLILRNATFKRNLW